MKYHYEEPEIVVPVYGETVELKDHAVYREATLYSEGDKGIMVVQEHFDEKTKSVWWGAVDPAVANDIYLNRNFPAYFKEVATELPGCPIYPVRTIMWSLRMKPLKREYWEKFFR